MYGQSKAYEQPERLTPAERYPYGYPLGEGVERHDPYDQECLSGVEAAHAREDGMVLVLTEKPTCGNDKPQTEERASKRAEEAVVNALVDQAKARSEHEPGGDGVGGTEPPSRWVLGEGERQRAQPGGSSCE